MKASALSRPGLFSFPLIFCITKLNEEGGGRGRLRGSKKAWEPGEGRRVQVCVPGGCCWGDRAQLLLARPRGLTLLGEKRCQLVITQSRHRITCQSTSRAAASGCFLKGNRGGTLSVSRSHSDSQAHRARSEALQSSAPTPFPASGRPCSSPAHCTADPP